MRIANCDGLKIGRCVEVITLHSNKVPAARCVVGHFFHVECKRKIISEARPNTSFQGSGGNCDTLETPCIRSFREQAVLRIADLCTASSAGRGPKQGSHLFLGIGAQAQCLCNHTSSRWSTVIPIFLGDHAHRKIVIIDRPGEVIAGKLLFNQRVTFTDMLQFLLGERRFSNCIANHTDVRCGYSSKQKSGDQKCA